MKKKSWQSVGLVTLVGAKSQHYSLLQFHFPPAYFPQFFTNSRFQYFAATQSAPIFYSGKKEFLTHQHLGKDSQAPGRKNDFSSSFCYKRAPQQSFLHSTMVSQEA